MPGQAPPHSSGSFPGVPAPTLGAEPARFRCSSQSKGRLHAATVKSVRRVRPTQRPSRRPGSRNVTLPNLCEPSASSRRAECLGPDRAARRRNYSPRRRARKQEPGAGKGRRGGRQRGRQRRPIGARPGSRIGGSARVGRASSPPGRLEACRAHWKPATREDDIHKKGGQFGPASCATASRAVHGAAGRRSSRRCFSIS